MPDVVTTTPCGYENSRISRANKKVLRNGVKRRLSGAKINVKRYIGPPLVDKDSVQLICPRDTFILSEDRAGILRTKRGAEASMQYSTEDSNALKLLRIHI
ncbi:hypothetical protein OnM2_020053 [Erysiphe neolycopersici]|uniref:Uncharacterized protein n=1 Tax=Erysiphe neolycopersici TaxID=212602 RepID=A0A420I3K1_9PEZI|nr:hypothetical protein OnM2_020053 [Erysiphe neolycopersici]